MSLMQYEGHAGNDSLCDCELEGCDHKAGSCNREGFFIVRIHGHKTTLCAGCHRNHLSKLEFEQEQKEDTR